MSLQPFSRFLPSLINKRVLSTSKNALSSSPKFEPPYLKDLQPKVGYHKLLNLQIKGYDFAVVEKYQSYLHKTMIKLNFNIVKTWSTPHQEILFETIGHRSTTVEGTCKLKIYERNIQMKNALVNQLPLLIDMILMTTPPGVSFSIHKHSPEHEDKIYFRDSILEGLQKELEELKKTELIGT